ncbi:VWA domain-containing protein [Pseudomonas sp. R2.Fl]|nr:VWA domain-containing protein [Pseudomonas sp. R2.Fl]
MSCCGEPMKREELDAVSAVVVEKLSAFLRTLRDNAFSVGLSEGQDAAALMAAGYGRSANLLRQAFKHLFCARRSEWERFDGLFDAFWLGRCVRSRTRIAGATPSTGNPSLKSITERAAGGSAEAVDQVQTQGEEGVDQSGEGRMEGASIIDSIARTDFRKLSNPQDVERAHEIAESLARAMRTRLTRRDQLRRKGYRIDLRRTIHANIDRGGVPIDLSWRRRKDKPLRLVLLVDASGSMSMYTGVFLRFVHGVLDSFREADAFLFHTRLVHVSDAMKERDAGRALDRLSMMVQGVGGGTRIGECLADFNRHHAARVIHSRTCVLILSDGYETGDAMVLAREMAALRRRCRRIAWLNPMMGWDGYASEAKGIRAALPHVDLHAPAHSLESLAALEPYLARL